MKYQQWGKLHFFPVFLYEHQQNLRGYIFTFSSVNIWAWSTRFPSQCNACSPIWWTLAATTDSITSTSHDAWNPSLYFSSCLFITFYEQCQFLWGEGWLVSAQAWLSISPTYHTTFQVQHIENFWGGLCPPNPLTRGVAPEPHRGLGGPWTA